MSRFQRMLSVFLTVVLVWLMVCSAVPVTAAEFILDPTKAKGSDYTQSKELAKALDKIFSGDIDVFSDAGCTAEMSMPLGIKMSISTQYYVKSKTTGNKISGWQCYIYANAVYNQLFREWVGHGSSYAHSYTAVQGGCNALSHELLASAGVRCGAYIRTTGNSDGSYSSNIGHSMIVLSYDEAGITFLEGNADGNGLIRITTRSWKDFNATMLTNKNRYIAHIAQPKHEIYDKLYPVCLHETYKGLGICIDCGETFHWERTINAEQAGRYQVTRQVSPSLAAPYEAAADKNLVIKTGKQLGITGACRNAFGDTWYAYPGDDGKEYYLPGNCLKYVEPLPLHVTCDDFSPSDQAVLARKAQPVKGTVSANHAIKKITAFLDGKQYAAWNAPDQKTRTVSLRGTDINQLLTFTTLEKGRHTLTLKVETFLEQTPVTIHESVFYMEDKGVCQHRYKNQVTQEPTCTADGKQTDTCILCGERKDGVLSALGHSYQKGVCTRCGSAGKATLSGMVEASFGEKDPMVILLRKDSKVVEELTIFGLKGMYFFEDLDSGHYILEVHKEGCVPWVTLVELIENRAIRNQVLRRVGDISGDDKVTVGDTAKLYAHVRNKEIISDLYALQCGDLSGDGLTNIGDVGRLYNLIKK